MTMNIIFVWRFKKLEADILTLDEIRYLNYIHFPHLDSHVLCYKKKKTH